MSPEELQTGELRLTHSFRRINSYSPDESFYQGPIRKLELINAPYFVLYMRLTEEGLNGQELGFEFLTVRYVDNTCDFVIPGEATHFALISEPPVNQAKANGLLQRFSAEHTNFPLKYPVEDPFRESQS